ncbi:hypothetical protein CY35_14G084100 [Sphagnum magellanicum]|nr:hypothetical protein CY35_14G084100 [Sphagnum magellanicum]
MANHHAWQPQEEGVKEICGLLLESKVPSGDQNRVWQQLQRCNCFPDFNNYLAFILCRAEGQSSEVRQAAGLMLKNNLKSSYQAMPLGYQQYIKAELRPHLGAADKQVRATVAIVISAVVQQGNGQDWPEIFQAFVQCLDSNDYNHMEGALDSLSKICEDKPEALDQDMVGLSERPINVFIPRLLQFFASPHAVLRRLALSATNQFVVLCPPALSVNMDTYLQGLFSLANDSAAEVRKLVCAGLVQLLEVQPSYLQPHMRNVIEYMLQANCDPDEDVSLESCKFWSTFCEAHLPQEMLREFLPRLISVLLNNMVYADDDEALLEAEDIKPRFHQPHVHGADGAEDNEEDDDLRNSWNLRKCSAAGLDILSTVFGDEILPILMPLVQARLSATTDSAWKEREVSVLALGAVAEGCISGLLPHLSQIVAFFVPLLEDKRPLVRSITCWTLSRYSKWIVQAKG